MAGSEFSFIGVNFDAQLDVSTDDIVRRRFRTGLKRKPSAVTETLCKNDNNQKSMKDVTPHHPKMRVPKVDDSLSWGKQRNKILSAEDNALVSKEEDNSVEPPKLEPSVKPSMSANQLAAKAMQLRLMGKHEDNEITKGSQSSCDGSSRLQIHGTTSRLIMNDVSSRQKKKEEDCDLHLAQKIVHNHRYDLVGAADEEYDYGEGPRKKTRNKGQGGNNHKSSEITSSANRFLTQQDRCRFCFENPARPKHLVIAIANFTYLSLPQQQPVVPGHCVIITMQHESSTRTIEDNVWDEIRNFKKCLIMMFAKQDKDVVFFETVMGLAREKRHCMIECVPLARDIAKQAPIYFKKAIDEAEDEWSQHNAKKLIDTSEKGLRGSIPKNFPYFHIEFGLDRGFVHVIDDEKEFQSSFGLNVIRGMLGLPAEDMYRPRRQESSQTQNQAILKFSRDWESFDWTNHLI